MSLFKRQATFSVMFAKLILQAVSMGYEVTLGDAYRDPRVFGNVGERKGYGHPSSAHKKRMAGDLNLFKDGKLLTRTEDHRPLGEWWESQGGAWGGRFKDGNHYSLDEGKRS
jgi:hypothetical protein